MAQGNCSWQKLMIGLLAGEDPSSSVVLLKSITEMCEEEQNKGGDEELWESIFRFDIPFWQDPSVVDMRCYGSGPCGKSPRSSPTCC